MVEALKEGGRGTAAASGSSVSVNCWSARRWRSSVTLLAGASLLIASFVALSHQNPGFKPEKLWVALTVTPQAQYPDVAARNRFADQMTKALRATPGLEEASVSGVSRFFGGSGATLYTRAEGNVPPVPERKGAPSNDITPAIFGPSAFRSSRAAIFNEAGRGRSSERHPD